MRSGKPCLLNVALWLLSLWYGPERRHKRPPVLIHCHGVQTDFNMLAETGVVETEHRKGKIPGQRSESESGRNDDEARWMEALQLANETLEARTLELTSSLEDLRDAQDQLVQTKKLASLGQLTAGIAHEIKNPLNFVNNFSSLSIELAVELQEAIKFQEFNDEKRTEIHDLLDMLQGNLGKIVQHGQGADSIVKNMLLHSRQTSGEHRSVDLNALVEESLDLAYHGARAEKGDFNITLQRSFDPAAGEVNLLRQEITRVLLNLISNSFYATTQGDGEPPFSAGGSEAKSRRTKRSRPFQALA